jgi:hypothetical protein
LECAQNSLHVISPEMRAKFAALHLFEMRAKFTARHLSGNARSKIPTLSGNEEQKRFGSPVSGYPHPSSCTQTSKSDQWSTKLHGGVHTRVAISAMMMILLGTQGV